METTLISLPRDLTPSPTSESVNGTIAISPYDFPIFTFSKQPIHIPDSYEFSSFSYEVNGISDWSIMLPTGGKGTDDDELPD